MIQTRQIIFPVILIVFCSIPFFGRAQEPKASFNVINTKGNSPLTVKFENTSSYATSFFWDFGNGNTSIKKNPTNVYITPGTYSIKLVAISANMKKDSIVLNNLIKVEENPVADFYTSNTSSCLDGNSFSFINTSKNSTAWIWDFGDGESSTLQHPQHSYSNSGSYTVKLIAKNNIKADIKVLIKYILINPKPQIEFTADTTNTCDSSRIFKFQSVTPSANSWLWSFGDNTSSQVQHPDHTYNNSGKYTVSLTITDINACSNTIKKNNYITIASKQTPVFSADTNKGCNPSKITFNSSFANASKWFWNFGDSSTSALPKPSHIYQNQGNYSVLLTITDKNNCTYSTTVNNFITIKGSPVANFTISDTLGCSPLNVKFTNTSANAKFYLWEFGDGITSTLENPAHTYVRKGIYTVKLHAYNAEGCEAVKEMPKVIIVNEPLAGFTTAQKVGCIPLTINFNNTSLDATQWLWDFGDGTTSVLKTPSHDYTQSGNFDVKLIVSNSNGCSDTLTYASYIRTVNPVLDFKTPATVSACAPFTTSFLDETPGVIGWLWNFGDGASSTLKNPKHTYFLSGFYTVSLLINMNGGCNYFIPNFNTFNIKGGIAGFSFTQSHCSPDTIAFTDTSGNAVSWMWNFGDREISTLQNPGHIYSSGNYTVSLTVTTSEGCTKSILKKNGVHINNCTTDNENTNSLAAVFGTGGSPPSPPPENIIIANDSLVADSIFFTSNSLCLPLPVMFKNSFPNAVAWFWSFGDGSTSKEENPLHIYDSAGIFDVSLIVQTDSGKTDTLLRPQFINTLGSGSDFSIQKKISCDSMNIELTDESVDANSWFWDFGDGETSTQQNPVHTYKDAKKKYTIKLSTTSASGCATTAYKSVYAGAFDLISTSKNKACTGNTINFYCINPDENSFLWDFGDGSFSSSLNPSHSYSKTGSYNVSLTLKDTVLGCSHTYALPDKIKIDEPLADFMIDSINCTNSLNVKFINKSTGTGIPLSNYCFWDFGDGSTAIWSESPSHTYNSPGVYTVTLSAYTEIRCVHTVSKQITVEGIAAKFSFTQDKVCLPITATFIDSSFSAVSWLWNFGDGTTSKEQNPVHVFKSFPTGKITLTVTSKNACKATITNPNIKFTRAIFSASASKGCIPFNVAFKDLSSNAVSWLWNFGDGSTSVLQHPTHTYTDSGKYTVRLIVQSSNGCIDTLTNNSFIKVGNISVDFTSPDSSNCAPSAIHFKDLSNNGSKWLWDFGDGSFSTKKTPNHIYTTPGRYNIKLVVSNDFGCKDSLVKPEYINVLGPIAKFSASAMQECPNKSIEFYNTSTGSAFSKGRTCNWNFGDGNVSNEENPIHVYDKPGEYPVSLIVTDSIGCIAFYTTPEPLKIDSFPVAALSTKDTMGCVPFDVNFSNESKNAVTFLWNFGDGTSSTLQNPSHTYANPGKYSVQLITFNRCGYADSIVFKTITVFPKPTIDFITNNTIGCMPMTVSINTTPSTAAGVSYLWDFGNGITSTHQKPAVVLSQTGSYTVSLRMTDVNGCSNTISKENFIYVNGKTPLPADHVLAVTVSSNTSTSIVWEPSPAKGFASYRLYRKNTQTGRFEPIITINDPNIVFYTDTFLNTLNTVYCYKLQTIDICGNAIAIDSLTEQCSINVTAKGQDKNIKISWTPYVGCNVSNYLVYKMENGSNSANLIATLSANDLSYLDTSIFCPAFYSYRIKAKGLCGNFISSSSDTAIAAPVQSAFANQKVNVLRSTVINNKSVLTEWSVPEIATDKITGYNIYRSLDNHTFSLLTRVQPLELYYIDNDVDVNNQNYYYQIEAVNSCGVNGLKSNKSSSILLTANYVDDQLQFSWTSYDGWDTEVDYYIIEKLNNEGQWEIIKKSDNNLHKFKME